MLHWLTHSGFMWLSRVAVLLAGTLTLHHILSGYSSYKMDFGTLLVIAFIAILSLRVWMPWSDSRDS